MAAPSGGRVAKRKARAQRLDRNCRSTHLTRPTICHFLWKFTCFSKYTSKFNETKYHYGDTHLKRRWRTKRRTKDLDQIDADIQPENAEKLLNQNPDLDKPGGAQFYCIHCARYFINDHALQDHFRTKVHKRRLKALELEPYTIEDSERAAGFGSFQQPQKRKIETQLPVETSTEEVPNKKMKTD